MSQSPTSPSPTITSPGSGSTSTNNDFFGGPASPPVILAILAIGMFGIAAMAVVGWRRTHVGRNLVLSPFGLELLGLEAAEFQMKEQKVVGEKPELWDMWLAGAPSESYGKGHGLSETKPIAACAVNSSEPNHRHLADAPRNFMNFHLPDRRQVATDRETSPSPADLQLGTPVQVAFAIVMPSPHRNDKATNHTLEYSIGLLHTKVGADSNPG
ncbi:hypothetical protein GLOTRDRAFT_122919 [Gloeophyllum trabeum ATCC 11539]|uniref:Uncharacterized protein n=1 Tax=Gloeophyllum trabeum (strain ATCC 11539 / FP-39264 / Madison 617) TaxID=670483 RepID=S7PXU6_GLOTA|nr:uncharacterized protein GLOTRDRAFT_122919 [Gloeophyllum trabeum ATCC 11539]EPQ52343.1 hypothetical protein GLOTRDRAFT_122919 [Gloeophyllum trabeum ATCC 11539]